MQRVCFCLISILALSACQPLPEQDQPPLIEGIPSIRSLTDSLDAAKAGSIKWSDLEGQIVYSSSASIDWKKEFASVLRDNVNLDRYKDAFTISDQRSSGDRIVQFLAKSASQEVRSVQMVIRNGRLISLHLIKERNNLLSYSKTEFHLEGIRYHLELEQRMAYVFNQKQSIHGEIIPEGSLWRCAFRLGEKSLPVNLIYQESIGRLFVKNGEELLPFKKTETKGDSLRFESEYFNAHFNLGFSSDSTLEGFWVNEKRSETRKIPVEARCGVAHRFKPGKATSVNLSGEHMLTFETKEGFTDTCMLLLSQDEHVVYGSVVTETGDYRWLEGLVRNDSLFLSTMDGTHAYLFEASLEGDVLNGMFYAGTTWQQRWRAYLNDGYKLRDPESITRMNPEERFWFQFPDASGKTISLDDSTYENKPVLVSIMGTWCSNCLDETMFLKEVRQHYGSDELEIVALDFELISDTMRALQNIERYVQNLELDYPVLLAALSASKESAAEALPMLNGIFSYPTLIVLDRNHSVVSIHTGFSGPATGDNHYQHFRKKYFDLIDRLVQ